MELNEFRLIKSNMEKELHDSILKIVNDFKDKTGFIPNIIDIEIGERDADYGTVSNKSVIEYETYININTIIDL